MRFNSKEASEVYLPSQMFTMGCLDPDANSAAVWKETLKKRLSSNSAARQNFVYEGYRSMLYICLLSAERSSTISSSLIIFV